MNVLIYTEPDDGHALAVQFALENMGHAVRLLFTADQPTLQTSSFLLEPRTFKWEINNSYQKFANESYEVVWRRRARNPYTPKELSHPDDYRFVSRENIAFYDSFNELVAPTAWWINPKGAAVRGNSKGLQLQIAAQCNLLIPKSLFSNCPEDIHSFVRQYEHEGVIYKPQYANFWFDEKELKTTYTTYLNSANLPSDSALKSAPGIYQQAISKQYELRVTCFGDYIMAAKIYSQQHPQGKWDWRAIPNGEVHIEPYELPATLQRKIRQFMRMLGLVFGSLDFIVTPEGEYYFLEVNEQGQFLWIEKLNREIFMLDTFVQFILAKTRQFTWKPAQCIHFLDDYHELVTHQIQQQLQQHVFLNQANTQKKLQENALLLN